MLEVVKKSERGLEFQAHQKSSYEPISSAFIQETMVDSATKIIIEFFRVQLTHETLSITNDAFVITFPT